MQHRVSIGTLSALFAPSDAWSAWTRANLVALTSIGGVRLRLCGGTLVPLGDRCAQLREERLQRNSIFQCRVFDRVQCADWTSCARHAVVHEQPHRLRPSAHDVVHDVVGLRDPVTHRSCSRLPVVAPAGQAIDERSETRPSRILIARHQRSCRNGPQFVAEPCRPIRTRQTSGPRSIYSQLTSPGRSAWN